MQGHDRIREGLRPRPTGAHTDGGCQQADGTPRPWPHVLRRGLRFGSAPTIAAQCRTPLPGEPSRPYQSRGAITSAPGPKKLRDASGFRNGSNQ